MIDFDEDLNDDYNTKYVTLTLNNKPEFKLKMSLAGVPIVILCGYNTRMQARWIIITSQEGRVLLSQTFMRSRKKCELNFNSNLLNLNYYVTLKPKIGKSYLDETYDYLNWANDFDMLFVGRSQDLEDRIDTNWRKVIVGN